MNKRNFNNKKRKCMEYTKDNVNYRLWDLYEKMGRFGIFYEGDKTNESWICIELHEGYYINMYSYKKHYVVSLDYKPSCACPYIPNIAYKFCDNLNDVKIAYFDLYVRALTYATKGMNTSACMRKEKELFNKR